ncbi:MAG: class I tRNA ligase family protein [Caldilineaceae bacterium]
MGLKFTGEVPFRYVYLHGLVRDEQGRKMSKSLDNVLDPLDLIREYGSDALRFTLLTGSTPGNDMKLSVQRIEANRNFANKIWTRSRFVLGNLAGHELALATDTTTYDMRYAVPAGDELSLSDRWILSRLQTLQTEVTRLVDSWQLGEAGRQLYEFLWNEYCDWYIEAAKVSLNDGTPAQAQATRQVLAFVLEESLRLLHPYMPFITETIWQNLPDLGGGEATGPRALIATAWPAVTDRADGNADDAFTRIQEAVRAIRNARSEYNVEPSRRIAAQISAGDYAAVMAANLPVIAALARLDSERVTIAATVPAPEKAVTLAVGGMTIYLPMAGLVDLSAELTRLQKEIENLDGQLNKIAGLLSNPGFINKAAANVVDRERNRQRDLQEKRTQLAERLAELTA